MKTFSIQTLGCKVNQYESEQIATLLRSRGLVQVDDRAPADLRIVNTCSVTSEAAAKSRQATRQAVGRAIALPVFQKPHHPAHESLAQTERYGRTIVTGCWATSNKEEAANLLRASGCADAVLTHTDDVAGEIDRLLRLWNFDDAPSRRHPLHSQPSNAVFTQGPDRDDESINLRAGAPGPELPPTSRPDRRESVKNNPRIGATSLPLLSDRHTGHQRAFLKIQDGCDAHCTYCIIPNLRPKLWSKPIDDAVQEATRLVAAGHREIVLTGIFLGAFGHETALRRRQSTAGGFGELIDALCTRVPALHRLRLSSLEPGDLTSEVIAHLKSHPQVVPHFHLPLQSGSDTLLRRMNRQYTRDDFMRMLDRVEAAFDRPAITTDIIVGFPGETDAEFEHTLGIVDRAKFIHIHAFPFSPRPGTAAARWKRDFVPPRIARERIVELTARANRFSFDFRSSFIGSEVELLVERNADSSPLQHGRCERYFNVHFEHDRPLTGKSVRVRIENVTPRRTFGALTSDEPAWSAPLTTSARAETR